MTEFVNDNGEYLEYGGDDVMLTKQVASFRNFQIKGDFTVSFKLSNNSVNRRALGYANVQQVGNHAFAPMPFKMVRNGKFDKKGFIIIEDDEGPGGQMGVYFIAGNSNWFKAFDFPLNNISNDSLQIPYTNASIYGSFGRNYGIVFPLIDYLYYRQKYDATFVNGALVRGQGDSVGYSELYPCLYLKTLLQELAKSAKIAIDGDLLDDTFFNSLIMTPKGPELVNSASGALMGNFNTGAAPYIKIQSIPDPSIKAVDFIKWLCFSFGIAPTFDEFSQTLTLNQLDKIKKEDAEDWSDYFQSHQTKYSDLSEHNYVHVPKPLSQEMLDYNEANLIPFGEIDIRTKKTDKSEQDIYTSPFAVAKDALGTAPLFWATPFVQFLKLTDGKYLTYTAVTNNGDGRARFTVDMSDSGEVGDQAFNLVFRVIDDNGTYTGYHVADSVILAASMLSRDATYIGTSTGKIYLQKLAKQNTGNVILSHIPSIPYNNVMARQPGFTVGGGSLQSTISTAYFSKPIYPYGTLNNYQEAVSYGELNFVNYNDISLSERRWNKINAFLRNAPIYGYFKIPESVFSNFNFQKFIRIRHQTLSGYFFIELIEGYIDSKTTVKAIMNYADGYAALTGYSLAGVKAGYPDGDPVPNPNYNPQDDPDIFDPISGGSTPVADSVEIKASSSHPSEWGVAYYFPGSGQNITASLPFDSMTNVSASDITVNSIVSRFPDLATNNGTIKFYKNGVLLNTISFINGEYIGTGIRYYTFTGVSNGDVFETVIAE